MRIASLLVALAVALPACRDDGIVALDELEDPVLQVSWYHGSLGEPLASTRFYVQLSPRQAEEDCLGLDPDVRVTVGDDPLSPIALGGWVREPSGLQRCTIPTFVLPGDEVDAHPHEDATVIEVSDGTATLGVVARGLFVERGARLEEPAADELHAGAPAVVIWHPATDLLGLVAVFFFPEPGEAGGPPSFTRSGPSLAVDGARIGFGVPEVDGGPGRLRVEASATVPTEDCHGLLRCDVAVLAVIREIAVTLR